MIAGDKIIRLIDFGEASILPLYADTRAMKENGLTAKCDIFDLGCCIYSLSTWTTLLEPLRRRWDEAEWLGLSALPDIKGISFGCIV